LRLGEDKSAFESALRKLGLVISVTSLLALSGCGEPVTFYEPGVYQGKTDPLVAKSDSGELDQQLSDRFQQGQARQ